VFALYRTTTALDERGRRFTGIGWEEVEIDQKGGKIGSRN